MTITEPPVAEDQLPPPPRKRLHLTGLGKLVVFFLVLIALFSALSAYVVKSASGSPGGREVSVVIEPGDSASAIADELERAGVIRNAWLFRLYTKFRGTASDLRPGEYVLRTSMSFGDVIAVLRKGPAIEFTRITIPEGKIVREIARIMGKVPGITAEQFLAEVTSGKYSTSILPKGSRNLEGVLFPKTYDFEEGTSAAEAVEILIEQFEKETAGLDWSRAAKLKITPYQALIIASMIEREARVPQDRAKISRVIHNRLARGMRLQIDATVQYGIFLKTGSYKHPLLVEDYQFSSPYNTYLIDELPPGPIASPGLASIEAALNPAEGDWLYYVLINDRGEHAFAETYEEFQRLKNSR